MIKCSVIVLKKINCKTSFFVQSWVTGGKLFDWNWRVLVLTKDYTASLIKAEGFGFCGAWVPCLMGLIIINTWKIYDSLQKKWIYDVFIADWIKWSVTANTLEWAGKGTVKEQSMYKRKYTERCSSLQCLEKWRNRYF